MVNHPDETAHMKSSIDENKLDRVVTDARRARETRDQSYRGRALKLYPWICGRCLREFTQKNVQELTVHHRDHNHDNNPSDGSNWELLCVYCHEDEHQRMVSPRGGTANDTEKDSATHQPFAGLGKLVGRS